MAHYPDAKYLLVEAQVAHEKSLVRYCRKHPNAEYVICAAGDHDGHTFFDNDDLLSGVVLEEKPASGGVKVDMFRIDTLVKRFGLVGPFLIKLDTHGLEVPILEGAVETLKQSNLVFIETYNFKINAKALKYYEMCGFMDVRGFQTIDIVGLMSRDYDGALWQMDMLFIPAERKEFYHEGFR